MAVECTTSCDVFKYAQLRSAEVCAEAIEERREFEGFDPDSFRTERRKLAATSDVMTEFEVRKEMCDGKNCAVAGLAVELVLRSQIAARIQGRI